MQTLAADATPCLCAQGQPSERGASSALRSCGADGRWYGEVQGSSARGHSPLAMSTWQPPRRPLKRSTVLEAFKFSYGTRRPHLRHLLGTHFAV